MNELTLKEMNAEKVVYLYKPNGKGAPGEIVYSFDTKEAKVNEKSSDDDTGYFAHKATKKIAEYVSREILPLKATQAWY